MRRFAVVLASSLLLSILPAGPASAHVTSITLDPVVLIVPPLAFVTGTVACDATDGMVFFGGASG